METQSSPRSEGESHNAIRSSAKVVPWEPKAGEGDEANTVPRAGTDDRGDRARGTVPGILPPVAS